MQEPFIGSPLTAREREVAKLIGLGLTNRQIGLKLSISQRTAGAHVQNILNKLGANNRAQIATWSAAANSALGHTLDPPPPPSAPARLAHATPATPLRPRRPRLFGLVVTGCAAVILGVTYYGATRPPATGALPVNIGALAYEAKLTGDGDGFSLRQTIGDPSASAIRFTPGAVEYVVVGHGGNTGNNLAMPLLPRYYAEVRMSVVPGSNVVFWFNLETPSTYPNGHLLIALSTGAEELQLAYFAVDKDVEYLGPHVPVRGLQSGRVLTISALVDPPHYQVYLDGRSVINIQHTPSPPRQTPGFRIFGEGPGTVRLSSIRVYGLT